MLPRHHFATRVRRQTWKTRVFGLISKRDATVFLSRAQRAGRSGRRGPRLRRSFRGNSPDRTAALHPNSNRRHPFAHGLEWRRPEARRWSSDAESEGPALPVARFHGTAWLSSD